MENLLKQLREEANFTQETVADKLGVSVNTIQNWERTSKLAKESLHELLDFYGVDKMTRNRVVLAIFGDNYVSESKGLDNFPEFLFKGRPDIVLAARSATLTSDEMELFGYSFYMDGLNVSNRDWGYGSNGFPMEYSLFKDFGGYFNTMKLINSIKGRIGEYSKKESYTSNGRSLARRVYNYGLKNPGEKFSFCEMSKKDIVDGIEELPNLDAPGTNIKHLYDNCKAVQEPVFLGTSVQSHIGKKEMPEAVKRMINVNGTSYWKNITYETNIDEVSSQCIEIDKKEKSDIDYQKRKKQYLLDEKAYDEHPSLYDKKPSFAYEYEYWLKLTRIGRQYIEWWEG